MRNKKIACICSGWHFPLHFYKKIANQKADLFCIAHRKPSEAHDKDIKLGNGRREEYDKILYKEIATEEDLKRLGWNYKLYPNTIGDWGCSNQWLSENDYKKYDAILFTHDDNFILRDDFLETGIEALKEYEIVSNSLGMPHGWLRGSCEFFSKKVLDKMGGKFDLSLTTLTREGKTDNPEHPLELNDWNSTVYPMMKFIADNKINVGFLSEYYRVSDWCIEGERGWIHRTQSGNTPYEEKGFDSLERLTILYTYFNQKERLAGIVKEKHPQTRVVIVDDCSPEPLQCPGIDCYRIEDDITWNQPGAKNLGFQESEGWIVCADIDHLITRENVEDILKIKKEKGTVYFLGREADIQRYTVYLIHKEDFEKIGGYDEDFSGHYGWDDIEFFWRCQKNLKIKERRDIKVKVYAEESSAKLERDYDFNIKILESKKDNITNNGKRIRFKWHSL